jgi:hypothetical protein
MRLTLVLLGHTFDLSLEPTAAEADTCSLDGGTTASTGPVGFVSSWPTPAEWQPPERTIPWDEPFE